MPGMGGQPQANQQPPQITDELPTVAMSADGSTGQRAAGTGVVATGDENTARVDRILRERQQAQRAADDIRDLREVTNTRKGPISDSQPAHAQAAQPKVEPTPAAPEGEVAVYDPASDAAAIAAMTGTPIEPEPDRTRLASATQQPIELADAHAATSGGLTEDQLDMGDRNPSSAEGMGLIATPTNLEVFGPNVPAAPTISRQSSVDPLLALDQHFSKRVANDPTNVSSQLEYQLLQFLRDQPVPRQTDIAGLNSEDQALLSAMCDALTNFRSVVRNQPNAMTAEKTRPFVEMAERIASQSDLGISAPMLCEEVAAFGSYTPLDPRRFVAGTTVPAVFYCEVDGFQPVLNEQQQYETKLSLELKLFSASREMQVWRLPTMNVNDVSRRRRRDFFIAKMIELPANLTADTYLLKAVVKDLQGNRVAEKTLQFQLTNPAGR